MPLNLSKVADEFNTQLNKNENTRIFFTHETFVHIRQQWTFSHCILFDIKQEAELMK